MFNIEKKKKSFLKKSNRDCHMNTMHAHDSDVVPSLIDDNIEGDDLPRMALDGTELPTLKMQRSWK